MCGVIMLVDPDFFGELDRFELMVRKRVSTAYAGSRRSLLLGRGLVAVGHREYVPGDDFRSIDWRVYGRTERLFVKQFEEEKSLTAHVLLDVSGSMGFGVPRKFDYAARLALGVAYLVGKQNERFSVSCFSEDADAARPKRGMHHLSSVIRLLEGVVPGGVTAFDRCMAQYQGFIRSRSLVVLISDFLFDLEGVVSGIYRFARNELLVLQVLDPFEIGLVVRGDTRFVDLESGGSVEVDVSPRFAGEYRERLESHNSRIRGVCDEVGASYHLLSTDKPIFDSFFEIMSVR